MSPVTRNRYKTQPTRKSSDTRASENNSWANNLKEALQKSGGLGDGEIDADYRIFLTTLCEDFDSSILQVDDHDTNTRKRVENNTTDGFKEDADPQYMEFLKNLRENGNAYALEVTKDNGGLELVVYEAPDQEIEHRPNIKRNFRTFERIKRRLTIDGNGKAPLRREDEHSVKSKRNLRSFEKDSKESLRRNVQIKDKIEEPKITRNQSIRNAEKIDTEKQLRRSVRTKNKIEEPKVPDKVSRGKNVNSVSHGVKKCSSQKRGQEDADVHEMGEKRDIEDSVTDGCYQNFLNNIHMEGDCVVYVLDNGKRLKYEEDDDVDDASSSDIEIWENDPVPESGEREINPSESTPQLYKSPMEGDDLQWLPNWRIGSQFREKLIENLKRPYDQEEFDELSDKLNKQDRPTVEKFTRKGIRKIIQDGPSKSLLKPPKDLKDQLLSVKFERPKALNILRGYFYWLQNLCHEGSFIPWKDPSCLAVMPGSR